MTYAFTFNASACSGCKACQAACKDKNNLPLGVLWRRVYEVTGGTWQRDGEAWNNTVFAYNLSMSCNHCVHPKCAGVCPVDAYSIRPDGIVLLDTTKCIGCGYCAWACPYGAPQYNPEAGTMTKCDLCFDNLEQGLPPACVAACPLRVLDYGETKGEHLQLWDVPAETHPYPLPAYSHTQPRLEIKPHTAMSRTENKSVANLEEVQSRVPSGWEEVPLVLYTLLTQMAVGGLWATTWMFPVLWSLVPFDATGLRLLPTLLVGCSLGAGMLASFAHLGKKKNAWRVLNHLRKSWLSREILFTLLFGLSWLAVTLQLAIQRDIPSPWMALTALLGLALVYSMSRVYHLPAAPGWNTWRTNAGFMATTLLLGLSLMMPVLAYEASKAGVQVLPGEWQVINGSLLLLLLMQLAFMSKRTFRRSLQMIRLGLIVMGMILTALGLTRSYSGAIWFCALILLTVLAEEGLGRWAFYQSRLEL